MSAIHAHCTGCGAKTSVVWHPVPKPRGTTANMKLLCAACVRNTPAVKVKGVVEK